MQYSLRVDYHEPDLGPLLIGGLKPFVERARRTDQGLALSYRTHWRHGPHVLIGLATAGGTHDAVAAALADHLRHWLALHPSTTQLDPDAYGRMAGQFAALENLDGPLLPIHENNRVTAGDFQRPLFWDDAALSEIQDGFISDSLDVLFDLIEQRLHSRTNGLMALVRLLVAIDRMAAPARFDYWPISIRAQAKATQINLPDVHAAHAAKSRLILQRVDALGGYFEAQPQDSGPPAPIAHWIGLLERLSIAIRKQIAEASDAYRNSLQPNDIAQVSHQYGLTEHQYRSIMFNRDYLSYRAFMNIIYMFFPLSGFTIQERLLAGRIISDYLDEHRPDTMAKARAGVMELQGRELINPMPRHGLAS